MAMNVHYIVLLLVISVSWQQIKGTGLCANGSIRLLDGSSSNEGRVVVCANNTWNTVCDNGWGNSDATVVCKQLGYNYGIAKTNASFGQGSGQIALENVACTGNETTLLACPSNGIFNNSCSHSEDAGVVCLQEAPCLNGQLRLVNGNVPQEGRVEVCVGNEWGTVCDDLWGNVDARVVCRQLGYSDTDSVAFTSSYFGSGTGSIFLDDVGCSGSESQLINCNYDPVTTDCSHSEDAGVRCQLLQSSSSSSSIPMSSTAPTFSSTSTSSSTSTFFYVKMNILAMMMILMLLI